MVEKCFASIKNHLYFYHVGPVRFKATIYRDNTENGHGGYVDLTWRPIDSSGNKHTIVELIEGIPSNESYEDSEKEFNEISDELSKLGRKNEHIVTGGGYGLGEYTHEGTKLRDEVYKQLMDDFKYLLEI